MTNTITNGLKYKVYFSKTFISGLLSGITLPSESMGVYYDYALAEKMCQCLNNNHGPMGGYMSKWIPSNARIVEIKDNDGE